MFQIPVRKFCNIVNSQSHKPFFRRTFLSSAQNECCDCLNKEKLRVTIIDSTCRMGQFLSLLLKQCPIIDELRLQSHRECACGTALDLAQIDTRTKVKGYFGSGLLMNAIEDVQILAVCSMLPKTPICEKEYLEIVGYKMKMYATFAAEVNPNAIFCLCCPPVESLVPLVSEEYKRQDVYDHRKIIGSSMVACSIANSVIGRATNTNPLFLRIPIIGGLSNETLVPVVSQTKPNVYLDPDMLERNYKKIMDSENKILEEKSEEHTGGLDLLYSFAAYRLITQLIKAIKGDDNVYECAYIKQIGEIGKFLPYMSSIVKLSQDGVENSYMPKINEYECSLLKKAAEKLDKSIHLGKNFITGDYKKKPARLGFVTSICKAPARIFALEAEFPKPPCDPCLKIPTSSCKDEHLIRSQQKAIKLRLEQKQRKLNKKIKPREETRTFCKK